MRTSMHFRTILYVNFSPYENSGCILDYITDHFSTVLLFSFNFHRLHKKHNQSTLTIFRHKKIIEKYYLFQIPTPQPFLFIFLPLRSVVLFFQLLYYSMVLKKTYGPFEVFFTVNAFTAWCGNMLKKLGLVQKTIFWVWDYYPPIHENKIIMFMRYLYWIFDKAAANSNSVIFLNARLISLRKKIGVLPKTESYPVVSIGTDIKKIVRRKKHAIISFAFLGALKKSQGLDFIFDNARELKKNLPPIKLHVFGSGPDDRYFRVRAKTCQIPIKFFGYIPDSKKMDRLLSRCDIGLAPYIPDSGNVSYYSDPSKIKSYITNGLPVITTNVFQFSHEIEKNRAGILFRYGDTGGFIRAVKKIRQSYHEYHTNAVLLSKKYYYKILYKKLFEE